MSDIPKVPTVATSANYPAGSDPWSGTATRVATPSNYQQYGWTPDQPIPAQHENYYKHAVSTALSDAQKRAAVKVLAAGTVTGVTGLAGYMSFRKLAQGPNASHALVTYSTDLRRAASPGAAGVTGLVNVATLSKSAGEDIPVFFIHNAVGGTNTAYTDTAGTFALPGGGAAYVDACTDVNTDNVIAVSLNGTSGFARLTSAAGPFAFAATSGWAVADYEVEINGSVASKPGEVRAFSYGGTFASTDGGVTVGATQTPTFAGATAPLPILTVGTQTGGYVLMRPTWDASNARWLMTTYPFSGGPSAATTVWTSANGVNWTYLATVAATCLDQVEYHRGWLWALGRPMADSSSNLEIYYSADGGANWTRAGYTLSISGSGSSLDRRRKARIVPMGPNILFQTTINGDNEYVILNVGAGY